MLNYVVSLTNHKDVRTHPCRPMENVFELAERFVAGVTKPDCSYSDPSTMNAQPSTTVAA